MNKKWENKLLFNSEGDGGGSGGATSLLGTPATGGEAPAGKAGGGNLPGAASGGEGAGAAGAANDPNGGAAPDWRSSLPKELQENASLRKFTSIPALAGAYVNAQKLIGGDKIPVPTEHTTPEEFRGILNKLGLPEKAEDYKIEFKEKSLGADFTKAFQGKAHELGVLPKQAQAMADWFGELAGQEAGNTEKLIKEQFEATVTDLKKDWGNAFQLNVGRANKVLLEYGGKEMVDAFNKEGLGSNKSVLQFLAKMGEHLYKEQKVVGGDDTSLGDQLSPKELDVAIGKLRAEPAYFNKQDPRHKGLVEEVNRLSELRWPKKA
jgi:hypothetical protein